MKLLVRTASVILGVLLIASLWGNYRLYQESSGNYRDLHRVRLDPFGLGVFAGEDPTAPAKAGLPVVVFFGDSRAAEWLAPDLPQFTFVNRGIGSQTTAQVLGRLDQDIAPLQPDYLVVQVGINDLKTIPLFPEQAEAIVQNSKDNIEAIVQRSLAAGVDQVILTTIFPIGAVPLERQLVWSGDVAAAVDDVNRFLTTLASDRVTVIETAPVLAGEDGMIQEMYSRDTLHLNHDGYAALNVALVETLTP
jgi:lysophospholipase L1-like esterase